MSVNDPKQLLISFIIPVLNGERDIERCLSSIQNQEFRSEAYEVLVLDNGSTDQTHQIIRKLGCKFQIIPKVGVSALRNLGAAVARGKYLAFVDADVEIAPHWLRHSLAAFEARDVVASGCFPGIPPESTWVQRTWDIHQRGDAKDRQLIPVRWLPSMNLMVCREAFITVGGFNEDLETAEDVDLCYRLGNLGPILNNPSMEAIHWGEAPDLKTFWRKEVWRGMGNLKGVFSHGLRWDELPSLGYPLYMMACVVISTVSICVDLWFNQLIIFPFSFIFLGFPAWILALKKAYKSRRPESIHRLFILYLTYGFARMFSVIKTWFT